MPSVHLLPFVCAYFSMTAVARPLPSLFERENLANSPTKPQTLSVEAIVGVIAIAVAILGIALPSIWPSLRARLDTRRHSRSRPSSTAHLRVPLVNGSRQHAMPQVSTESSTTADAGGVRITRSQRARSDYYEQQRELMRRTLT